MRRPALILALLVATLAVPAATLALPAAAAISPSAPSAFGLDSMWDDGKAEVVTYVTSAKGVSGYDTKIVTRKTQIVVDPQRSFDAIEMRILRDEPKGSDTVHGRTTAVLLRKTLSPVELWDTSGAKSVHARVWHSQLEFVWRSEQGVRNATQPWGRGDIFYDALPVWLRGLDLLTPAVDTVRMLPTQLSSMRGEPQPVNAAIRVVGPAGKPSQTSRGGLEVDVSYEGKVDRFWFHPGPGHVLLVWEKADGTTLTLRKNERVVVDESALE